MLKMLNDLNRRDFLKKSIIGSAAAASALSLEEKTLLAAAKKPATPTTDAV
ncbi:MAG: twin-arginine translocation signal domain-containing protein, partial [Phycisphaerae bacterium]|nr:twin-arginine translocation signal domain-containing protein [Phycisphaerae bacterium]NIP51724.1 twin-arginine translocation signal domain-containing protein [Phycisphaerae bacterium]NIU57441.1 twin-arginine translocation signal domain-containing protein [Phycisphaerae bacterium]NIW92680.1 twin-arginine translocation signal domain-containing protein [Phycisphaerae bacterium]NIW98063.1 twin-arginine translocation signal domain-containing protein [Phycisphaerae bacterium]